LSPLQKNSGIPPDYLEQFLAPMVKKSLESKLHMSAGTLKPIAARWAEAIPVLHGCTTRIDCKSQIDYKKMPHSLKTITVKQNTCTILLIYFHIYNYLCCVPN